MSESAKQILYQKSRTIDLDRLGGIFTTNMTYLLAYDKIYTDFIDHTLRFAVAQGMLQGLGGGMTEGALIVRDLSPMFDLLDTLNNGPNELIYHNQWIQNYWKGLATSRSYYHDKEILGDFTIYATDRNVRNDQKVIVIYGIELLNPLKKPLAEEIQFWRGSVKLSASYPISPKIARTPPQIKNIFIDDEKGKVESKGVTLPRNVFYHNPVIIFDSPIIYKKDDIMKIKTLVSMKDIVDSYSKDEIKLLGFTIEPIGMTVMG